MTLNDFEIFCFIVAMIGGYFSVALLIRKIYRQEWFLKVLGGLVVLAILVMFAKVFAVLWMLFLLGAIVNGLANCSSCTRRG